MLQIPDGTKISFDTNKIQLKEYVLQLFNVNTVQELVQNNEATAIIHKHHSVAVIDKKFIELYRELLSTISLYMGTSKFYYQKITSFRVHKIGKKTVNFHSDAWYGHGQKVITAWVPLVATNEHNAIWVSDSKTSDELNERFRKERLSISETNKLMDKCSKPQIMNYGEILLFNSRTQHGAHVNLSNEHRMSFDFRILMHGDSPGAKPLHEFYQEFGAKKIDLTPCLYYLYTRNPLMENLSHSAQRNLINSYCSANHLRESKEITEIHGVDHYPFLHHYLKNENFKNIVMASMMCLPVDRALRSEILYLAESNNIELHFTLENRKSSNTSVDEINNYYDQIMVAKEKLKPLCETAGPRGSS